MKEETITLALDASMGQAMFLVLVNLSPKGRSELRSHSRLTKALKAEDGPVESDGPFKSQPKEDGGTVVAREEDLRWFTKNVDELLPRGTLPGGISTGLSDLLDLVDDELTLRRKKNEEGKLLNQKKEA